MFRKSKTLVICFAFLCLLVPMNVKAGGTSSNMEFYVDYAEPDTSGYNGYINVMYSAEGGYRLYTYFWNIQLRGDSEYAENNSVLMCINVSNNRIVFQVDNNSSTVAIITLACYDWSDNLHVLNSSTWVSGIQQIFAEDYSGSPIIGYNYSGNVSMVGTGFKDVPIPIIFWNNSVDAYYLDIQLKEIIEKMNTITGNTSNIGLQLEAIWNQNNYTNQKLEALESLLNNIKTEQEESNTWLEKIFNWLKDSPGQEKQEATTQGNQSTSDATTAITDNSQGFIDSLGNLSNALSSTQTYCRWTFPALYLPEIPGVMERTQLTSEQEINFNYWVEQIPYNLMLLVRSFLTIALIIYCFKEVYGTVSYVLTLRGGSYNE